MQTKTTDIITLTDQEIQEATDPVIKAPMDQEEQMEIVRLLREKELTPTRENIDPIFQKIRKLRCVIAMIEKQMEKTPEKKEQLRRFLIKVTDEPL